MAHSTSPAEAEHPGLSRLVALVTDLREEACQAETKALLADGVSPQALLSCFMDGMSRIGQRFETGNYYIAALIMAGEIMRQATETLSPLLIDRKVTSLGGRVVLGTIEGDIHDLGKNLFAMLLRCHQFEVIDLGVDVPARVFLESIREHRPDVVAVSCVLTTSVPTLKEAVALIRAEAGPGAPPMLVGGTCLDRVMAAHVGADHWAPDAATGLRLCQDLTAARR